MATRETASSKNWRHTVVEIVGLEGSALGFFFFIVGTGLVVLFFELPRFDLANFYLLLALGLLVALSEMNPIPFFKFLITVSAAIHIAVMMLFGVPAAIFVGAVGAGVADLAGKRGWTKMLFNACQYAVTIYLAGSAFFFLKTPESSLLVPRNLGAFLFSSVVYVSFNQFIICTIVALSTNMRIKTVIRKGIQLEAMHLPTMAPLAFLIVFLYQLEPLTVVLLGIPLVMAQVHFMNYVELINQAQETMEVLADAIDHRDPYTACHSARVAQVAEKIAISMKLNESQIEQIKMAGRVHDIGKISIEDAIVQKDGPLDPEEYDIIKEHSQVGYSMLQRLKIYRKCAHYVLYHHEQFDGTGYPSGLRGEVIPLGARILAIADTFDAITSDRPYRRARTRMEALEEIKRCAGSQFDPEIVRVLGEISLNDLVVAEGAKK